MLRRIIFLIMWIALTSCVHLVAPSFKVQAQEKPVTQEKPAAQEKSLAKEKSGASTQQFTGEQIVELSIYLNGGREGMAQIRRSGVERGRITRTNSEGKAEQATYERRFIRGETLETDRVRMEQKMPTQEFSLIYAGGQMWGIINAVPFTPRPETSEEFLTRHWYSIEAFLRYKENGSTVDYIGREKQKGLDLHVVDLTDKEKRRTRFYVSVKSARVLWLEYELRTESGSRVVKYARKFHDYRLAQGTLVPYRTVLYKDGAQIEETHIMTITFGPKLDEALFRNPDSPASTTAARP